jgi:hypothetical protein
MGKVHGSLARAGKVKSQTRKFPVTFLCAKTQLTFFSQGKQPRLPLANRPESLDIRNGNHRAALYGYWGKDNGYWT